MLLKIFQPDLVKQNCTKTACLKNVFVKIGRRQLGLYLTLFDCVDLLRFLALLRLATWLFVLDHLPLVKFASYCMVHLNCYRKIVIL